MAARAANVIEDDEENAGFFKIILAEGASLQQVAFKGQVDEILTAIANGLREAPDLQEQLPPLRNVVTSGLTGVNGGLPDLNRAAESLDVIRNAVQKAFAARRTPAAVISSNASPGAFYVSIPNPTKNPLADTRDLNFELKRNAVAIPADQLSLKADVEDTLTTLQAIFPDKNLTRSRPTKTPEQRRFEQYQYKLLLLAQVGLQTEPAYPGVANQALTTLRSEIMAREGGRVKNAYMIKLGIWALSFMMLAISIYILAEYHDNNNYVIRRYKNLWVLWAGCMIGTWLSFGVRRVLLSFNDLGKLENDRLEPGVRLMFTGLMTLTLGFIFICDMVKVTIGGFSTGNLLELGSRALLIGIFCGISEQALPGTLTRRASQFLSETRLS
jgi:hypothetical protein